MGMSTGIGSIGTDIQVFVWVEVLWRPATNATIASDRWPTRHSSLATRNSGPYSLKAFFTASTALSSSQGNSFTFTVAFCPALLKVLVTSLHSRPMWP